MGISSCRASHADIEFVAAISDRSNRVARQELLDSPDVQQIIVDRVPTMVLLLDDQGRIAKVNANFEEKTGYAAETIIGRNWFETFIPEEDRPNIQNLFADVLEAGTNPGHVNAVRTADGRTLKIEWFANVITDPRSRTRWLLNVGHDITERLEYEQALETAKRESERANAAKSRFLATASHDLRQPLQTLVVLNEALARLSQDPKQREMLAMQRDALDGMRDLLNALLDIGKFESGAIEPQISDVPVSSVFERIRAELEPLAADKGLELIVERSTLIARTDAALFTQLLQNIVGNAIRYTLRGSVRLASKPLDGAIEISISDTGIGISDDQHSLIFDEFYQVDRDISNRGLGLGLSIVKRIAELLHCGITLDSELDKGTTFRVRVPAAVGTFVPRDTEHGADDLGVQTSAGTVLLVDDEAAVLAASRLLFEIEGLNVIAATSAEDAAAKIESVPSSVDVIVTDYHLRGPLTGTDVIASVRERFGRTIPAILITGDTKPDVGAAVAKLEILSKPIEPEELLRTIQVFLDDSG